MTVDPHLAPHWGHAALVTIDVQRDFLSEAPHGVPGTTEVLPQLGRLTEAFRAAGRPIVHIVRLHSGEDVDRVRRTLIADGADFVLPGSPGRLLAPGVAPDAELDDEKLLRGEAQEIGPGEYVLFKPRWGAFYRTPLEELLLGLGVDTVVFAGCNLPNCPRASIVEAHERDFRVVLVADAVSQAGDHGLREVAALGTVLLVTDDVVTAVRTAADRDPEAGRG